MLTLAREHGKLLFTPSSQGLKSKEAVQCVIHWQVHDVKDGQQSAEKTTITRKVRDFMRDPVNMTLVETSSLNQTWQQNPDSLAMCAQLFLAIGRVTKVM